MRVSSLKEIFYDSPYALCANPFSEKDIEKELLSIATSLQNLYEILSKYEYKSLFPSPFPHAAGNMIGFIEHCGFKDNFFLSIPIKSIDFFDDTFSELETLHRMASGIYTYNKHIKQHISHTEDFQLMLYELDDVLPTLRSIQTAIPDGPCLRYVTYKKPDSNIDPSPY